MRNKFRWRVALSATILGTTPAVVAVTVDAERRPRAEPARVVLPVNDARVAASEDSSVDKALRQKESMERPPAVAAPPVHGAKGRDVRHPEPVQRGDGRAKGERDKSRSRAGNGRGRTPTERPQ